jgi:ribonuclease-3
MISKLFKNQDLLKQAFTHKSWLNENEAEAGSNERLEFLGDAVIEYVVSVELYNKFPKENEGYLTALRSKLVNTANLAEVATNLNLGPQILFAKGEAATGSTNKSILADTFEAVVGAMYLDRGVEFTYKFIKDQLLTDLDKKLTEPLKNPKNRLQEFVQKQGYFAPRYRTISATGPDHAKKFIVGVYVDSKLAGKGAGNTKLSAELAAASHALEKMEAKG